LIGYLIEALDRNRSFLVRSGGVTSIRIDEQKDLEE